MFYDVTPQAGGETNNIIAIGKLHQDGESFGGLASELLSL
jgi:hypothetical protein